MDNHQAFCAWLTDLSEALDCLNHDLLTEILHFDGMLLSSLMLLSDYVKNREQRSKMESSYSSLENTEYGVLQGSILDLPLIKAL